MMEAVSSFIAKIWLGLSCFRFNFLLGLALLALYLTAFSLGAFPKPEQKSIESAPNSKPEKKLDERQKDKTLALYLLSIEPGRDLNLLWSWWGHTALLVRDQEKNLDLVFDYGLFENMGFGFLYNYLRGQAVFFLGIDSLANTLRRYKAQKRAVYSQGLYAKKQALRTLYQKLLENARVENRRYIYHHYYNNCTTKVRDIIDEFLFDHALYRKYSQHKEEKSIRERAMSPALIWPPIFILFSSLVGYNLDSIQNAWRGMYLPVDLMLALESSYSKNKFYERYSEQEASAQTEDKAARVGAISILGDKDGDGETFQSKREKKAMPSSPVFSWLVFTLLLCIWLFVFYLYPLLYPKKKLSSLLGQLGWWLCYLPLSLLALLLAYLYLSDTFASYQTVGYNFALHALNPLLFCLPLARLFCRKGKRARLWFALHRAFLLFLELGCILAVFLAPYTLPLMLIVLCMERSILIQVKRGCL